MYDFDSPLSFWALSPDSRSAEWTPKAQYKYMKDELAVKNTASFKLILGANWERLPAFYLMVQYISYPI